MDSINFTVNETVLTGAEGLLSSVDDRTIASTPAPIAVSTVGRDRGTRRIFTKEIRGSLFSISPPPQDPSSQNNAEDSLGLLPPGCLMAPVVRSDGIFKPQVLFPQLDEEDISKIESSKENSKKELFCFDAEEHQSVDSGVGQTNSLGSHVGQTMSRRSIETNKTDNTVESSTVLDGVKSKTDSQDRQTFFESLFRNSSNSTKTVSAGKPEACVAETKPQQDLGIFQSASRVSKDRENDPKEFAESYFDNFDYKMSIKADLQHMFSDFGLGFCNKGQVSPKTDSSKASDSENPTEHDQDKASLDQVKTGKAPVMDGPFKMPFLPRTVAPVKKDDKVTVNSFNSTKSDQAQRDSSVTEWGPSINFGDSLVILPTESTSEWGPSIQFGETVHSLDDDKSDFGKKEEICNPFEGFDQDVLNGCEEFIEDPEAKAELLADDMQQFVKENPFGNITIDITKSSYRGANDTFMDQTIGTYLAAGSKEFDSLSSAKYNRERPDIGMPAYSPPAIRRVIPILQPSELYSPINIRNIRSKPPLSSDHRTRIDGATFAVCQDQTSFPSFKDKSLDPKKLMKSLPPADAPSPPGQTLGSIKEKEIRFYSVNKNDNSNMVVDTVEKDHISLINTVSLDQTDLLKRQDVTKGFQNFTLPDRSINLTADMTYSALHKFIEGLDNDVTHPEHMIVPEVNRHLEDKKASKSQDSHKEMVKNLEKNSSVAKMEDNSVFKVPFPVKNSGSVGIKPSKVSNVTTKTLDHSARGDDMSTNLQHLDDLSASLTMSLVECSLTPYTSDLAGWPIKLSNNNNNNSSNSVDYGHPQVMLSSHPISETGRNVPQKLRAVTNPLNKVPTNMPLAPLPENYIYDYATMDLQTMSNTTYFSQNKQGSLKAMGLAGVSMYGQHRLCDITDLSCDDISTDQDHTLCPDNSQSVLIHGERGFAYSTPMPGSKPFEANELQEKSILPMITPMILENILKLPKAISFPEATCVMLSQEIRFTLTNLLDKGVKCSVTIREVTLRGQRMGHYCPFDLKPQYILSGHSFQDVQVIFRPKEEGEHTAIVEFFATNMIRPQETRFYALTISAVAEKPSIKIWPEENVLNFGTIHWGHTTCRSINIQNNGQATVPLIFSISRKEASLCFFTFTREGASNKSSISFTCRPDAKGSVLAISLPGVKEGKDPCIQTVELYCTAKGGPNIEQKYQERCEQFQAILDIGVDMPVNGSHLKELKLIVAVGMYKLHVDKDNLVIAALPGNSEFGSVNILNSGNIPMPVELELTPSTGQFSISSSRIIVPPNNKIPIDVSFSPQHLADKLERYNIFLNLLTPSSCYSVKIIGKVRGNEVKITSSMPEINFGGVNLCETKKQLYRFNSHSDAKVKIYVHNPEGSAFKLINEIGHEIHILEMIVEKGRQYEVWVSFCPTEVNGYSALLTVKAEHSNKYTVPIRGYGGRSHVEIKELINEKNELFLNVGKFTPGQPVCYEMKVNNTGPRCCFIKTHLEDVNGIVFQPFQASIVPSLLLLPPHESANVMVMIFPPQRVHSLSSFSHLATIKLKFGDEVNRQHFLLKPAKRGKHHVKKFDFSLPVNSTQKEIIHNEMQTVPCCEDTFSVLKNSLSKMYIKVIGQLADSTPLISSHHRVESEIPNRQLSSVRPVLSPLSPNITQPERGKDEWTVAPKEIWIKGDETASIKQSVQVINFSSQLLRFYVECGENLIVFPIKGTVKSKDTTMLNVNLLNKNIAANWFGLIHVFVSPHDKQLIKVFLTNSSDVHASRHVTPSPVADSQRVSSNTQRSPGKSPAAIAKSCSFNQQRPFFPSALPSSGKIQGSDKAILMTTEAGTKSYVAYNFTNTSHKPLSWKLAPFVPPYVKDADETSSLYRVDYEVFKLVPATGTLQPDETEKITIEFSPRSKGYFNQDWGIHETDTQAALHNFTVLAKSITNPCKDNQTVTTDSIPEGLSRTSLPSEPRTSSHTASSANSAAKPRSSLSRDQTTNSRRSNAVPLSEKPEKFSPMTPVKSLPQSSNVSDLNIDRNDRSTKQKDEKLAISDPNVQFPKVPIGGTMNLKINIQNKTDQKVEIVVDYEPKPPFMIKHYSFQIEKDKIVMFPVIFKPRHTGHFADKVIFKDKASGTILTAFLKAEC
ncbi:hypothetical protein Btru_011881 [Bulinus truncatus]|nr:hypothetical protein Btru_011881 [Bulinus truncatus]